MSITFRKITIKSALVAAVVGILILTLVVMFSSQASAAPIDVLKACDNKSQVCADRNIGENSLFSIISNIINLLILVVGVISVIMIIIGGFRYTTSAGDAGQTKSARDTIIYAIVGLVIAVMAYAIVNFVLSRV